jgi:hypothetical protein
MKKEDGEAMTILRAKHKRHILGHLLSQDAKKGRTPLVRPSAVAC